MCYTYNDIKEYDYNDIIRNILKNNKEYAYYTKDLNYSITHLETYDLAYNNYNVGGVEISSQFNNPKMFLKFNEKSSLNLILLISEIIPGQNDLSVQIQQILLNNEDITNLFKEWHFWNTKNICYKNENQFTYANIKIPKYEKLVNYFINKKGLLEINFHNKNIKKKSTFTSDIISLLNYQIFYIIDSNEDPFITYNNQNNKWHSWYNSWEKKDYVNKKKNWKWNWKMKKINT